VSPEPREVGIHVGELFAGAGDIVVKTLLGSCVSACLYDPRRGVGGMNHILLPEAIGGPGQTPGELRYGLHAMDLLLGSLVKLGADRASLCAKLFGGANTLDIEGVGQSIGPANVAFVDRFCAVERIRLIARDVGGSEARQVRFHVGTGRAWVRRLPAAPRIARDLWQRRAVESDVTLFDPPDPHDRERS
jgi:chemotaxis receptor (MCP) glutamine deamidase CheD